MHRYSWLLLNFVPSFSNSNLKSQSWFYRPASPIQNELLRTRSLGFQARTFNYCFGKVVIMFTLDPMRNHARLTDNSRAMSAQRAPTKFSTASLLDQIWARMRLESFEACGPLKHHQTWSLGVLGDPCYVCWPLGTLYEPPMLPKPWFCSKSVGGARQPSCRKCRGW